MEKQVINEEMRLEKEWFEESYKIETIEDLTKFVDHLLNDYEHDYGTVCHAIGACALAAARLGAHKEGITGFQAGAIMWDFIREWCYGNNKCGMKIVNYDDMLYPQYYWKYEKTITKWTWEAIQKEAQRRIEEAEKEKEGDSWKVHPNVLEHWRCIVSGQLPFGYSLEEED